MKKLLLATLLLSALGATGQALPAYDTPRPSGQDPDVWRVTLPLKGARFIELYYTPLADLTAANERLRAAQPLSAADRQAKLRRDSADFRGGLLYVYARCVDRNTIDGALTVVVLDEEKRELLRRPLAPGEAELTVSDEDYARIYAVPVTRPLPYNACVLVVDERANEQHEFRIRPAQP